MDQLTQSDLQALRDFVRECYALHEFETFEDFLRNLVASLSRLIPSTHVTYNEMHPAKAESHNWVNTSDLATVQAASLWEQHMNEHPVMRHIMETDDRHAIRISDLWSFGELHDRGLYHDFYRLYDIEDALCITIPCTPPAVIGAGWHRDEAFTDRELLLAEWARPHITQAWKNAKLVSGLRDQLRLLHSGWEDGPKGLINCDGQGRVQCITAAARRYLGEYFTAPAGLDHHLPLELLAWVRYQVQLLAINDRPAVQQPLEVERGEKRLTVRLMSKAADHLLLLQESSQSHGDAAAPKLLVKNAAREKFGLSEREFEILTWVAQGKTNGEIATILGSKLGTVKKHLEHIFPKLGVETRTAAAMVLQDNESRQMQ